MTEPDDRPGSDDPEDRPAPATTAPVTTGPSDRDARSGPAEGGNVHLDVSREPRRDPTGGDPSHGPELSRSEDPRTEDPEPEDDQDPEDPEFHELADDTELEHALEALLLVVDAPVDEASLATALHQTPSRIRQTLHRMSLAYTADRRGIDLRRAGEGWRFYTRDRYAPYVEKMLMDGQRARLTRAALETLAVVAYRQPVTRARVSAVRGVNCDGVLRTLLTRGLVEEAGTEEHTGGTLFRTTELFLERLGISSVAELPPLAPLLPDIDAIDDLDS
ncbi:SMC-Scp complex subunit ScpB [Pseudonocardia sp. EV170527-09]|uniref:SMC-Scp complex subunit ScpB n=1 Tax=Pseudonocardia sp. EV170527-09 TaxID=2603411 RepID=UPI0011F21172|nr:SMC-Scp complex subunit ScpB [Pseudonocardia sp. EV170527-09]KAA1024762.1 SMC-Scp complex subunit ScpB [Pseudonocardia sp. EV170527-09]